MESTLATLMAMERTRKIIRKTITRFWVRFWVPTVFWTLVIAFFSLIIVIGIGGISPTIKFVLKAIAVAIFMLILIAFAFRVSLKDL